jgi:hypothetical protein
MKIRRIVVKRSLLAVVLAALVPVYVFSQESDRNLAFFSSADTAGTMSPVKPAPAKGSIMFANAFRWNGSGPTGGYWSENDASDNVFRPVFSNVSKYRLQIYNRSGSRVFESSELYRGWDGYLSTGERAMQGVYVWKATGTFTDGTSFSKTGDVTFIY